MTRPTLLLLTAWLMSSSAFADSDPHVHGGVSTLSIAVDGSTLEMRLVAPGNDLVGFEHAPSSDEDRHRGGPCEVIAGGWRKAIRGPRRCKVQTGQGRDRVEHAERRTGPR